jgi:hypothetical protein
MMRAAVEDTVASAHPVNTLACSLKRGNRRRAHCVAVPAGRPVPAYRYPYLPPVRPPLPDAAAPRSIEYAFRGDDYGPNYGPSRSDQCRPHLRQSSPYSPSLGARVGGDR